MAKDFSKTCQAAFDILNHDADQTNEAFHIGEDFLDKLPEICFNALKEQDTVSESAAQVIRQANPESIFELFWCGIMLGDIKRFGTMQQHEMMASISDLLGDEFNPFEDDES